MTHRKLKTAAITGIASAVCLSLVGCSTTYNRNSIIEKEIQAIKLNNGTVMKAGFIAPKANWKCKQVAKRAHDWGIDDQMEGLVHINGAFGALSSQATDFANKHPKLGINYVYMYVPNQHHIAGINIDTLKNAYNTFYKCQHPPKKMTDFFKAI